MGAKTVKGPGPLRVSTSPACSRRPTRVEKSGFPAAISTIVPEAATGAAVGATGAAVGATGASVGATGASVGATGASVGATGASVGVDGIKTASIAWITPLDAITSAAIMLASFTINGSVKVVTSAPLKVGTLAPSTRSPDSTSPSTTWYSKTCVKSSVSDATASSTS